jgi:hypothetical protein
MVVVAKDPAELITLSATRDLLAQGAANACLAELYTSHQHGQQAIFERQVPPTLRGEYPNIDDVLPERWPAAMSTPGAPAGDQFQLLRHNVFIDLPGDF